MRTASLLADIAAHPDDDAPRLVWADAVGGERGELVALQCALARDEASPAVAGARRARVRALLAAHGRRWCRLPARRVSFRRGFVEAAELDARSFVEHHDAIFAAEPTLRCITFEGLSGHHDRVSGRISGPHPPDLLRALVRCPGYERLSGVGLDGLGRMTESDSEFTPYGWESLFAECFAVAMEHDAFSRLRSLRFPIERGEAARVLASRRAFERIERAELAADASGLVEVLATMPALRALDLTGTHQFADHLDRIPAGVRHLRIEGLHDATLAKLAAAPVAAKLERLEIHHSSFQVAVEPLAAFPKLRSLVLDDVTFGQPGYAASRDAWIHRLAALSLPTLRELHVSLPSPLVEPLARAFGAHLELLDVSGHFAHQPLPDSVRALVAGDLRRDPWDPVPTPAARRLRRRLDVGSASDQLARQLTAAASRKLGVLPSFSRPRVSDDNPLPEALFRTLKYRPGYPDRPFALVDDARRWVAAFVGWYNDDHQHSAIRFVTPSQRHAGRDGAILAHRASVYETARRRNPQRWSRDTRNWTPIAVVRLNPEHGVTN